MRPGVRALGVAESFGPAAGESTLAGVVIRADGRFDGCSFSTCTVGGTDVTDAIATLWERLDREDVRYVLVAGVALAWYNLLEPRRLADRVDRPVLAVTFEDSEGLEDDLREAFDGEALAERLDRYRALPDRCPFEYDGHRCFYRAVGLDDEAAEDVLAAYAGDGSRPEPLRAARFAARAADEFRRSR